MRQVSHKRRGQGQQHSGGQRFPREAALLGRIQKIYIHGSHSENWLFNEQSGVPEVPSPRISGQHKCYGVLQKVIIVKLDKLIKV
jgi:hypothetical protein